MTHQWAEHKPGEWWHDQTGPRDPNVGYPPDMYISFPADETGKPFDTACLHLYSLFNGQFPDDADADPDVLHICGAEGLDELVDSLASLRAALYGPRPALGRSEDAAADSGEVA